ncbi:excalibur calcium-binding domain-containing protein [Streptomyces apocyni]|uniref:excalibur calcium-binding domain-containing protein n=1 Tax=Streptomyces apocyni TaxID=2654677 RepID=UPI0012E9F285|nr:excalibur calcium-binding domain-containing protein [Streptomyces apocyni]
MPDWPPQQPRLEPEPRRHTPRPLKISLAILGGLAILFIGVGIGLAGQDEEPDGGEPVPTATATATVTRTTAPTATATVTRTAPAVPAATVTETVTQTAPESEATFFYENCDEARAAGAAPVRRGDPGYGPHLDADNDGVGCE